MNDFCLCGLNPLLSRLIQQVFVMDSESRGFGIEVSLL
mgnify:CR=1 FL=1